MKKSAMTKNTEQQKAHMIAVGVIVVVTALVIFELSPLGGNVRFYAKWIECGQKPVSGDVSIGFGAKVKNYITPPSFEPVRLGQPEYFCTPLEAELAGYSASPNRYEFPNINAQN